MYRQKERSLFKHMDFLLLDLIVLAGSYILAWAISNALGRRVSDTQMAVMFGIVLLALYFILAIFRNVYSGVIHRGMLKEAESVLIQSLLLAGIGSVLLVILHVAVRMPRTVYVITLILGTVLSYLGRILWKRVVRKLKSDSANAVRLLLIVDKNAISRTAESMGARASTDFKLTGMIVVDADMKGEEFSGIPVVANYDEIEQYVVSNVIDQAYIRIKDVELRDDLINMLLLAGVVVHMNLIPIQDIPARKIVQNLGGNTVLTYSTNTVRTWQLIVKRVFDIFGGLAMVVVTGILYLFIAPKVKRADPGSVFYTQTRIGKNGRPFKFYKFRSMYLDADKRKAELMANNKMDGLMFKMDDDPRILPGIGKTIREKSLDEFPQGICILKGDMSLVGTRPPLPDEYDKYNIHHKSRLSFKPGLTGMWQANGRSDITDFEEVVRLDNEYIENWNLRLDLKLFFKTLKNVLKGGEGAA